MDQWEDREEGVPPSRTSLSGEHENQRRRPGPEPGPGPGPSCLSFKSNKSKSYPNSFKSSDPHPSERIHQGLRPEPEPSCVSFRSGKSKGYPNNFKSSDPPASERGRKRSGVGEEEQLSCCSLCQDVLKDPVSTSCGHWFCRRCITSYWDQSAPSGLSSCPQCGDRSRTRRGQQTANQSSSEQDVLQEVLEEHQISLRRRCERVTEGSDETGSTTLLNRIYTELYITEGQSEEVQTQHEVEQLQTASRTKRLHEAPIRVQDIFKALPEQHGAIRVPIWKRYIKNL